MSKKLAKNGTDVAMLCFPVSKNGQEFTKHFYAGTQRIASKLGNGRFNNYFRPGNYAPTAGGINYLERHQSITQSKEEYIKSLGIAPGPPHMKGIYADPSFTGQGYPDGGTPSTNYTPPGWPRKVVPLEDKDPTGPPGPPIQWYETMTNETVPAGWGYEGSGHIEESGRYFYHSDHLGSTSYVTDFRGRISQYVAYTPYGESLLEEHSNTRDMPYLFNGKERYEETGLYYYGARYYDSEMTNWWGVDPLWAKYPDIGGYVYCGGNPIRYTDPTGMGPEDRVRYAKSMSGISYPNPNEVEAALRTENTTEALKYMDCSEFVSRVLAADNITDGVKYMRSGDIRTFLSDETKFAHSKDKPQVGDIAVWDGHVGVVTAVDTNDKIKLTHARGVGKLSQENPHFATPEQYRNSTFYGYFHPINETESTTNSSVPVVPIPNSQEKTYFGGVLQDVIVTAPAPSKRQTNIPHLKPNKL
ncbi:hypothetical protein FACS189430_11800 [Bacteroidia bacterium]|nr:hypothetical protein FACS189430_11800 [Bacteroidia bacterium]